jgi:hypothetical protein
VAEPEASRGQNASTPVVHITGKKASASPSGISASAGFPPRRVRPPYFQASPIAATTKQMIAAR